MEKHASMPRAAGRFLNPLRAARVAAGLTQDDLGRLSGCSGNIISRLELCLRPSRINARNQPKDLVLARRIADVLDTEPESIFPSLAAAVPGPAPAVAKAEDADEARRS